MSHVIAFAEFDAVVTQDGRHDVNIENAAAPKGANIRRRQRVRGAISFCLEPLTPHR